jgi:nucleoside-diphosphate-sugar epimerase/glycosyltransferase involved in cell wall biosynthesis
MNSGCDFLTREETESIHELIDGLRGPILVVGASGFIGSLFSKTLLTCRTDVTLLAGTNNSWRLRALSLQNSRTLDITDFQVFDKLLSELRPRAIFNLSASGAYQSQTDFSLMTAVNVGTVEFLGRWCSKNGAILLHAGSSSEYGRSSFRPVESSAPIPNSNYGITKFAGSNILTYQSESLGLSGAALRLYSVYGPLEDPLRLFPTLIRQGLENTLPPFSGEGVSRDFVYISDVIRAFLLAARWAQSGNQFDIFNIGSGAMSTMVEIAEIARSEFGIHEEPVFVENLRAWDLEKWCADSAKASLVLSWRTEIDVRTGLSRMRSWYDLEKRNDFLDRRHSVQNTRKRRQKISAIVACYRDEPAIPEMYHRLKSVFLDLGLDYEIIFVNDGSPDLSSTKIAEISSTDACVIGLVHSRNFGSQAAFLSGLRYATGDSCVVMDGDLQDPPEMIGEMYPLLAEGYEVVYGQRVSREASLFMNLSYRLFYRLLRYMSPFKIPVDAGDFSLITREVVDDLLSFGERELFLRTSRAYIGRKQIGVPYHRPERPYGRSTNNFLKNVQWAIRGVVSASRKPLSLLSTLGVLLVLITTMGLIGQLVVAILFPEQAPPGIVTVILLVGLFGAVNLLAISIIGEYTGRILDEVRGRPRYIQSEVIRAGEIRKATFRDRGPS